ncbi:MAG: hypothetical protein ACKVGZ_03855 [Alphaproteobacteria bacterium]|jgi:hypothetical protein
MTAYLIVRAEVLEADRQAFDHWYETEHLPDAKACFGSRLAQRGWSDVTPGIHIALYQFEDLDQARALTTADGIAALIAEFDRVWEGRVHRTREVVGIAQILRD